MKAIVALLVLAMVSFVGCSSNHENPFSSTEEPQALTKPTVAGVDVQHTAFLLLQLTDGSKNISNARIQVARSISGASPNYLWEGTTENLSGYTYINIDVTDARGVAGYYTIRATDNEGKVLGIRNSIPMQGNYATRIVFDIGINSNTNMDMVPLDLKSHSDFVVMNDGVPRLIGGMSWYSGKFVFAVSFNDSDSEMANINAYILVPTDEQPTFRFFAENPIFELKKDQPLVSEISVKGQVQVRVKRQQSVISVQLLDRIVTFQLNKDGSVSVLDDGLPHNQ